jgi:hypothetical protein
MKVGKTGHLKARLHALKNTSPVPIHLLRTIADPGAEQILHKLLKKHRKHSEWFEFNEASAQILNSFRRADADFVLIRPGMSNWS